MARPESEYLAAAALSAKGISDAAVGAALGIPRSTVRDWRRAGFSGEAAALRRSGCARCEGSSVDGHRYAYLLGLYLGDGHLAALARGVYRLRIFLDKRYPEIVSECAGAAAAMRLTKPLTVGVVPGRGCVYVSSYWKHWPCLFPQHGAGPKHKRPIRLEPWQDDVVREVPGSFLRGLFQSDGCRVVNRVGRREYPRYMFCNHSTDIIELFCRACRDFGVGYTRPSWRNVSIARAEDVAHLDEVVGPKR